MLSLDSQNMCYLCCHLLSCFCILSPESLGALCLKLDEEVPNLKKKIRFFSDIISYRTLKNTVDLRERAICICNDKSLQSLDDVLLPECPFS